MTAIASVEGKRVIVTGGGGGLGSVLAAELTRLGASVVVCGRTQATLDRTVASCEPGRAWAVACDIRDPESVTAMLDAAVGRLQGMDGLVNNASGLFPVRAENLTPGGFHAVVAIALEGTFTVTRALAARWLAAGWPGAVVNVLTPYAWMGGPGFVHTAAAKGGVLAMTRTLGVEWAGRGVRVNAIAPGWMEVGGTAALAADPAARARLLAGIPAGRFLDPREVARVTAFLLSDTAAYITGECLTIDGAHHLSKGLLEFGELPSD